MDLNEEGLKKSKYGNREFFQLREKGADVVSMGQLILS